MKKLLLMLAVALLPCLALAQTDTLKTVPINKSTEEYASILAQNKVLSSKVTLFVEGMPEVITSIKGELLDNTGKPIVFANVVDALNYVAQQGWLFVNTYNDGYGQRYLLRRPVKK